MSRRLARLAPRQGVWRGAFPFVMSLGIVALLLAGYWLKNSGPSVRRTEVVTVLSTEAGRRGRWQGNYVHRFIDRADMVKLLLARGADPNKRMVYRSPVDGRVEDGLVALMLARSAEVVAALVNAGADPNMSDADGRTPLMRVVLAATPEAVEQLLQAGADLAARSRAGLTAAAVVQDRLQWLHDSWSHLKQPQAQERKLKLERVLGMLEAAGAARQQSRPVDVLSARGRVAPDDWGATSESGE